MTLISLLLVLLIERVTTKSRYWQTEFYVDKYLDVVEKRDWMRKSSASWALLILLFLPTVIFFVVMQQLSGGLIELIVSTAILMVCVGCPAVRATYKCFLQAANRGDFQACSMYAEQLNEADEGPEAFGQNLVWQNYRHYAAVILWFTALGAAGAVLYVLARNIQSRYANSEDGTSERINQIMYLLDWLPVRITALGFLLVGHFSRAFPIWIAHLPDPAVSAKTLLLSVAVQAEEVEPDENDCTEEPCTLVRLAKRNIMFLTAAIAILTLSGWLD
ncbi:MAG: AmpE protein [Paraglaciecola sp.]|jgi:AmpE protein